MPSRELKRADWNYYKWGWERRSNSNDKLSLEFSLLLFILIKVAAILINKYKELKKIHNTNSGYKFEYKLELI